MNTHNANDQPPTARQIRRALLSVSDKTNLIEFARVLHNFGVELISTGGTAKTLRDAGLKVTDVSDITGFPEMMDGRVKTLHPKIHGALLAMRDNDEHIRAAQTHGIEMIDLLVVNLYPFAQTIACENVTLDEAIENIDIGGPAMIRSAAKNFRDVAVIVSPDSYNAIIDELNSSGGTLSLNTRSQLARQAFAHTAEYDAKITSYLATQTVSSEISNPEFQIKNLKSFSLDLQQKTSLRYGENPHQQAALYTSTDTSGIAHAIVLHGKEMSYNNYLDADAAWNLACDFDETACAIIKHTNPAGASVHENLEQAYRRALACDPISAFGGIVAFNRPLDAATARACIEIFTEVIIAPDYTEAALEILRTKKNLRVLKLYASWNDNAPSDLQLRQISGGYLLQTPDTHQLKSADLKIVTARQPTEAEIRDLSFAWTICKHTKSNAIIYAKDLQTIGVGAGQMSRVDSVRLGAERAVLEVKNSVLASDAFFPFRDGIDQASKHGITAIIQPGGSIKDNEVIEACNEHNLAMVFTGIRHFKH